MSLTQKSYFKNTVAAFALMIGLAGPLAAAEVNIYSYRQEALIKPQLEAFKAATGIGFNLVTGSDDALIQRLINEGAASPADIMLTVDAARLGAAKEKKLLQPVKSPSLEAAIPAQYRDPDGYWFGLGLRARLVFYAALRVKPGELSSYEALAEPKWKDRLVVRSSNHIYNQSLLASLIHHLGPDRAEAWARGIVANMARKPQGGDSEQLLALAAGIADVALLNHYYYARLAASEKTADRDVVAKVKPFWPNQDGRGAHVNVSGAGVTASAKNREAAIRLIEFLAADAAQRIYAEIGHEYPAKPGVAPSAAVAALGPFKADAIPLDILGRNNAAAVRIFDRAGWR